LEEAKVVFHGRAKTSGGFIWKLNKEHIVTINNDDPV
jgi:hypothetical protein